MSAYNVGELTNDVIDNRHVNDEIAKSLDLFVVALRRRVERLVRERILEHLPVLWRRPNLLNHRILQLCSFQEFVDELLKIKSVTHS